MVDDDDHVRTGLAAILNLEADIEVVGRAPTASTVPSRRPIPVRCRAHGRADATRRRQSDHLASQSRPHSSPAVVVITPFESDDTVNEGLCWPEPAASC